MEFCQAKASDQSGAQREAMLKDLAAGFDMFMELKSNLEEGTKVLVTVDSEQNWHKTIVRLIILQRR